jgi:23S rRNA (cytidine1920-2'-O)/16S rRNA (cytidine1409-2'-O)-methyltransferase
VKKTRLDILLTERGLVESRSLAQRMIMAGQVRVADQVILKPSQSFVSDVNISIEKGPDYVSRGGDKLVAALRAFELLELKAAVCVDVGASTGGFTDCLLQHGASKVYAIDVGYGILHWKLRNDPRVISMEKTNARYVSVFDDKINLVTIDASFISLRVLLPVIKNWLTSLSKVVALIKPQFEVGRSEAAKGEGVIRDAGLHKKVLQEVLHEASEAGFFAEGLIRSPLLGPKGNTEFLVLWSLDGSGQRDEEGLIRALFEQVDS